MVGYLTVFFLLGAAAATPSKMERIAQTIVDNQDVLASCQESIFGINFTSCEAVVGDVEGVVSLAESSESIVLSLASEIEEIITQFSECSTESIFKKITCYETVISDAKAVMADAEADLAEMVPDFESALGAVDSDVMSCIGKSSTKAFEAKMSLCKLKKMLKSVQ